MFGNNSKSTDDRSTNGSYGGDTNRIGKGTVIQGEVKSDGVVRIDGKIVGTVSSLDKLVIGSSGIIEGDISCKTAIIEGKVYGRVEVSELLDLKSSAFVEGDIITKKLVVEEGAHFQGTCSMSGNTKATNGASSQPKAELKAALKEQEVA